MLTLKSVLHGTRDVCTREDVTREQTTREPCTRDNTHSKHMSSNIIGPLHKESDNPSEKVRKTSWDLDDTKK